MPCPVHIRMCLQLEVNTLPCIQDWHKAGDWPGQTVVKKRAKKATTQVLTATQPMHICWRCCVVWPLHNNEFDTSYIGLHAQTNQSTYCLLQEQHVRSARSGREIKEPKRFENWLLEAKNSKFNRQRNLWMVVAWKRGVDLHIMPLCCSIYR